MSSREHSIIFLTRLTLTLLATVPLWIPLNSVERILHSISKELSTSKGGVLCRHAKHRPSFHIHRLETSPDVLIPAEQTSAPEQQGTRSPETKWLSSLFCNWFIDHPQFIVLYLPTYPSFLKLKWRTYFSMVMEGASAPSRGTHASSPGNRRCTWWGLSAAGAITAEDSFSEPVTWMRCCGQTETGGRTQ